MFESLQEKGYFRPLMVLLSGLLFWLSWKAYPIFIFFAFVPLLWTESLSREKSKKYVLLKIFLYAYSVFFIWNLSCTWWIYYASFAGMAFAVIVNSFLMCIPFVLFSITRTQLGDRYGQMAFVLYWICFEYFHLNWDISWVWLNLGNVFAFTPEWVQWYEYTGTLGGTLWVLLLNGWIWNALKANLKHNQITFGLYAFLGLLIPLMISFSMYWNYEEQGEDMEVVVAQPNIDPYTEQFIDKELFPPGKTQAQYFMKLVKDQITGKTALLAYPEASLSGWIEERNALIHPNVQEFSKFRQRWPSLSIILGTSTYIVYQNKTEASPYAFFRQGMGYYDVFNTALMIDTASKLHFYHKTQLVVGVEKIPYYTYFKPLIPIFKSLGGADGSMRGQDERTVYVVKNGAGIAPVICYESIFGEFIGQYAQKKAGMICIITNDAWWDNTEGHVQHFHYARLRAIENRKSIARSANTGISGFINQRGDILQKSSFYETTVLKETLKSNTLQTYYSLYGDYIGRLAWFIAVFIFLTGFIKKIVRR